MSGKFEGTTSPQESKKEQKEETVSEEEMKNELNAYGDGAYEQVGALVFRHNHDMMEKEEALRLLGYADKVYGSGKVIEVQGEGGIEAKYPFSS